MHTSSLFPRAAALTCALACATLLAACASPQPSMAQKNERTRALVNSYSKSLDNDARLAPLFERIARVPNEATPDQLTRMDKPGEADRPLLRELAQREQRYRADMQAQLRANGVDPRLLTLWEGGADATDVLRAQLHNGQLSWGQYNTRVRDITTVQRMAMAETMDALDTGNALAADSIYAQAQDKLLAAMNNIIGTTPVSTARASSGTCQLIGKAPYCQ